jgi:hypothetical protein
MVGAGNFVRLGQKCLMLYIDYPVASRFELDLVSEMEDLRRLNRQSAGPSPGDENS